MNNQFALACQKEGHQNEIIYGLCFNRRCSAQRTVCSKCNQEHSQHLHDIKGFKDAKQIFLFNDNQADKLIYFLYELKLSIHEQFDQLVSFINEKMIIFNKQDLQNQTTDQINQRIQHVFDLELLNEILDFQINPLATQFNKILSNCTQEFTHQKLNNICQIGDELRKQKDYQDSLKMYQIALDLDSQYSKALCGKGRVLIELSNIEEAKLLFQHAIQFDPLCITAYIALSDILIKEKKYDEAIQSLNQGYDQCKFLSTQTQQSKELKLVILVKIGDCFRMINKQNEAIRYYNDALQLDSTCIEAYIGKGHSLRQSNQYQAALNTYNEALIGQETNIQIIWGKADCLRLMEQYDKALKEYDKVIIQCPDNVNACWGKSEVLRMKKKYKDALEWAEQALSYDSRCKQALMNKALILYQLNRTDEAKQVIQIALDIDNNFEQAKQVSKLLNKNN